MQSFRVTITDPEGFHARLAGQLVREARRFPCRVMVRRGNRAAGADQLFHLLALGVKTGETITVTTEGERETEAARALEACLRANQ